MTKRYLGNIITQNPTPPAGNFQDSAAKGVWSLEEQLAYQKAGLWPIPGNALDITDVFSTYVYSGTSAEHTITNGIDLAGEGGMIWGKVRSRADQHWIVDSERGTGSNNNYKYIMPNLITAQLDLASRSVSSFNSNGFTLQNGTDSQFNESGEDYASWTFRKAPKFFDVVTWTGNGVSGREISHNLGTTVGCVMVKNTSNTENWMVYHIGSGIDGQLNLNTDAAATDDSSQFNDTVPSSTVLTLGSNAEVNANGQTYVAYLFAHNNGDGGFGPDNSDIIKCGSYTGNGSSSGNFVDLGFEPQFIIIKNSSSAADWVMFDNMRGVVTSSSAADDKYLFPNGNNSEGGGIPIDFNATGFTVFDTSARTNANTNTFIYMAIRRGPLAQPESGTEVFAIDANGGTSSGNTGALTSGFPVDLALYTQTTGGNKEVVSRLNSTRLFTNLTNAENATSQVSELDFMDGFGDGTFASDYVGWMWKRAPGYFDVQAFTLGNSSNREVKHNLQAIPEMIWWKERSGTSYWMFWHKSFTSSQYMSLHLSSSILTSADIWGTSAHTSTGWYMKETAFGSSGNTCVSYTFATVAGVSKVGSATHSGTTNVDCGFSSGARFVLLKRTDSTGDWYVWDSVRGIVSGNDPYLLLNSTAAEVTNTDLIDPLSSGFTITSSLTAGDYIFYAIA